MARVSSVSVLLLSIPLFQLYENAPLEDKLIDESDMRLTSDNLVVFNSTSYVLCSRTKQWSIFIVALHQLSCCFSYGK
jgi:hypothetical protein